MSGLLYCIKGLKNKPSPEDLKACGLEGESVSTHRPTEIFIDGGCAVVFTLKGKFDKEPALGFWNDKQEWVHKPNTNLYVGWNIDDKPKPEAFLKKDYLEGHKVILGDENEWTIPIARKFQVGCILPKTMMMIRDGELEEVVVSKYIKLQKIGDGLKNLLPAMFGKELEIEKLEFMDTD